MELQQRSKRLWYKYEFARGIFSSVGATWSQDRTEILLRTFLLSYTLVNQYSQGKLLGKNTCGDLSYRTWRIQCNCHLCWLIRALSNFTPFLWSHHLMPTICDVNPWGARGLEANERCFSPGGVPAKQLHSRPVNEKTPCKYRWFCHQNCYPCEEQGKDVLVNCFAPWCGHCQRFKPRYQELWKERRRAVFDLGDTRVWMNTWLTMFLWYWHILTMVFQFYGSMILFWVILCSIMVQQ